MPYEHGTPVDDPDAVDVNDAATVMIVRDHDGLEVLMVQRGARLAFGARAWVFPGGRVDTTDRVDLSDVAHGLSDADASHHLELDSGGLAWWLAACRETLEEAGLLLSNNDAPTQTLQSIRDAIETDPTSFVPSLRNAGLQLDLDSLVDVARFITPVGPPRRFDTRFFLAEAPAGQVAVHDDGEMVDLTWIRPQEAIDRWRAGEHPLMSVTHRMLACLAPFDSVKDVMTLARSRPESRRVRVNDPHGEYVVLLPGEPGYETAELEIEHGWVRLWQESADPQ
jgi:8-oxo-dGTP pyrophosphatase MutT (NUDIX family)